MIASRKLTNSLGKPAMFPSIEDRRPWFCVAIWPNRRICARWPVFLSTHTAFPLSIFFNASRSIAFWLINSSLSRTSLAYPNSTRAALKNTDLPNRWSPASSYDEVVRLTFLFQGLFDGLICFFQTFNLNGCFFYLLFFHVRSVMFIIKVCIPSLRAMYNPWINAHPSLQTLTVNPSNPGPQTLSLWVCQTTIQPGL